MSGVYGGHLLEQLFSINSIISEHKTKTVKQKAPFTKEEATFCLILNMVGLRVEILFICS